MIDLEGDGGRIKPGVDRVKHGTRHRHAVMGLQHRWRIGEDHRDRITLADAELCQRGGQPAGAFVELPVGEAQAAMNDRRMIRPDTGRSPEKGKRSQRLIIGGVAVKTEGIDGHGVSLPFCWHGKAEADWQGFGRCGTNARKIVSWKQRGKGYRMPEATRSVAPEAREN